MYRFAKCSTFGNRTFSTPSPNADTVDDIALFRFVAEATGFVGAGGTSRTMDYVELTILPAAHSEKKSKNIRLFVLVELYRLVICLQFQAGKMDKLE